MSKELLRQMLQNMINDDEVQAAQDLHQYVVAKTQGLAGFVQPEAEYEEEYAVSEDEDLDDEDQLDEAKKPSFDDEDDENLLAKAKYRITWRGYPGSPRPKTVGIDYFSEDEGFDVDAIKALYVGAEWEDGGPNDSVSVERTK